MDVVKRLPNSRLPISRRITSNDVLSTGLALTDRRAGQILPASPWCRRQPTTACRSAVVIFPGNVGATSALAEAIDGWRLARADGARQNSQPELALAFFC